MYDGYVHFTIFHACTAGKAAFLTLHGQLGAQKKVKETSDLKGGTECKVVRSFLGEHTLKAI